MHAARSRGPSTAPLWYTTHERPLTRNDVGRLLIARDCCGNRIVGAVAENAGGVVLRPHHAELRLDIPVSLVDEYQFGEPDSRVAGAPPL
jgi:hypothetical protein